MADVKDKISIINELSNTEMNTDVKNELLSNYLIPENSEDGLLDKIFGKRHAEMYVALVVAVFILISGLVCTVVFKEDKQFIKELWQIFIPALTLVVGYIFGKR